MPRNPNFTGFIVQQGPQQATPLSSRTGKFLDPMSKSTKLIIVRFVSRIRLTLKAKTLN